MRFAQIIDNKAHWVFEADFKPDFAPNITLVDITGNEEVQEGWDYNEETGEFTKPVKPEINSELLEEDQIKNHQLELDYRVSMLELGL